MNEKPMIVANWKMNLSLATMHTYFNKFFTTISQEELEKITCIFCPSHPFLYSAAQACQNQSCQIGAQDVSAHEYGAYTGESSSDMLKDVGCDYVLIGHSERRRYHHESQDLLIQKINQAFLAGVWPIICVGESLQDYEEGRTNQVLQEQVVSLWNECPLEFRSRVTFAYEPLWAIGSGLTPDITEIESVHKMIADIIIDDIPSEDIQVLYGGSLNANNAEKILSLPNVTGGLIGGASLLVEDFVRICRIGACL